MLPIVFTVSAGSKRCVSKGLAMRRTHSLRTPTRELVCAAQRGDVEAFGLLYQRYRHRVFAFLVVRLRDQATAEDLTNETFVRALGSLSSYRYTGRDVSAWLITIARNMASDALTSARHRRELLTDALPDLGSTHVGPEEQVIAKADFERVSRHFALLSDDQRRCIELRFLEEVSTLEAARRLNRNADAVRALLSRAVRRLSELCAAEVSGLVEDVKGAVA